jgi:ribosomal silencing factor RsfS
MSDIHECWKLCRLYLSGQSTSKLITQEERSNFYVVYNKLLDMDCNQISQYDVVHNLKFLDILQFVRSNSSNQITALKRKLIRYFDRIKYI